MNFLVLSTFLVLCVIAVSARYPYDDAYVPGSIVPGYGYDRHRSKYPINREGGQYGSREGGQYGSRYGGQYRRNSRYGRNRDELHRDYPRRRHGDYDTYLPPRGIGGHRRGYDGLDGGYDRHDYGRDKPQVHRPPLHHDDEVNYGGYNKITGIGIGYN